MRCTSVALTFLLAVSGSSATAADDCANPLDQATLSECIGKDFVAADKALNAIYREMERRIGNDAETKKLLVAAQRAWISFRDAECEFASLGTLGGTMRPTMITGCKEGMTKERTQRLRTYLSCKGNDLSCPVPPVQ